MRKDEKRIIIHSWVSQLCNYYADYIERDSENHKLYAEMALELIPRFLSDFGVKTIKINRVLLYSFNLTGFGRYMQKHHPYIKLEIEVLNSKVK